MRNRYAGKCYRCGEMCEAGEGHFEKKKGGGWEVQHAHCAIKYRGTNHRAPETFSYDDYLDTLHPFSSEALGQDW